MTSKTSAAGDTTTVARGAGLLIALRMVSRLITFALNQAVIASLSPAAYGLATVRLQLLIDTAIFLAREAVRRTALRASAGTHSRAAVRNLAWLALPVGALVVAVLVWAYGEPPADYTWGADADAGRAMYTLSVRLFAFAALAELAAEPAFAIAMLDGRIAHRVFVEANAVLARCVVTYVAVSWGSLELLGFALGHVAHGLVLLVGFSLGSPDAVREWGPSRAAGLEPSHLAVLPAICAQTGFKYALNYGGALLMVSLQSLFDQGVYAMVTAFGSLAARLVFAPIEEAATISFSRDAALTAAVAPRDDLAASETSRGNSDAAARRSLRLATDDSVSRAAATVIARNGRNGRNERHERDGRDGRDERDELKAADRDAALRAEHTRLSTMVRFQMYVGLLVACFGPPFSALLLDTLYGQRWAATDASTVLAVYCVYVLVMAANGILEAFVHAVASPAQVKQLNLVLALSSGVYAVLAVVLMRLAGLGVVGLLAADGTNMALRIVFAVQMIRARFDRLVDVPLGDAVPPAPVLAALAASSAAMMAARVALCCPYECVTARVQHLSVGLLAAALVAATVVQTDVGVVAALRGRVRAR